MSRFGNISLKTILGLIIATMGLLLVVVSTSALVEAVDHSNTARRVATSTVVSKHLFRSLIGMRNERGSEIAGLLGESPIGSGGEAAIASGRTDYETGYADALKALSALDLPELTSAVGRLKTAHDAVAAMLPKVEAALHQPKSTRDPSLAQEWPKLTQSMLDAILATSDPLEASLKLADPVTDHFLSIKRAAWTTRLNLGLMVLRTQTAVATGQSWGAAEVLAWSEDRARAALAWTIVTEAAARKDAPRMLVDDVAMANANFTGPVADARKALVGTLSAGRKVDVSIDELRKGDTTATGLVVDVVNIALEQMVARAEDQVSQAMRSLILDGLLLIVALALSVGGFLIVRRRVSRPILALTATIEHLAQQDFSVEIPAKTRDDEVGRMQTALLVL
ncbi:MAG TPA: HAMP domain-containing protein, partial [Stellaceae bacterium]|nr:HAMP domain-containing protein [Stellaceae bacterium]